MITSFLVDRGQLLSVRFGGRKLGLPLEHERAQELGQPVGIVLVKRRWQVQVRELA